MKKHLTHICGVIASIFIIGYAQGGTFNESDKKNLKAAELNFVIENYEMALHYFKMIINKDSLLTENQTIAIGLCFFNSTTEKSKAIPYFEKALNSKKAFPELYSYLGQLYQFNNNYKCAIIAYETYLKSLKNSGEGKQLKEEVIKNITTCYQAQELEDTPMNVKIKNLGAAINTKFADYGSVLSRDGQTMYYTSCFPEEGNYEKDLYDNIYYTDLLKQINNLPCSYTKLPGGSHDAILGFSPNEEKMFVYGEGDIYSIKTSSKSKWVSTQKLNAEINSSGKETSMALSSDGKTFYFASDRKGGFGGLDLYKSELSENGMWGTAVNLGPTINTTYDEDAPFISLDKKTLYFSSKGHLTMGGFDVFQASLDKSATPKNMGAPINSVNDDIYFNVDGQGVGYLSSDRKGGYGSLDIYKVMFEPASIPFTEIKGSLHLTKTLAPLNGTVTILDMENGSVAANTPIVNGAYSIKLVPGKKYTFQLEVENFILQTQEIFIPYQHTTFTLYQSFKYEYLLGSHDTKIGQKTSMTNGFFDLDGFFEGCQSFTDIERIDKAYFNTITDIVMFNDSFKRNLELNNKDELSLLTK